MLPNSLFSVTTVPLERAMVHCAVRRDYNATAVLPPELHPQPGTPCALPPSRHPAPTTTHCETKPTVTGKIGGENGASLVRSRVWARQFTYLPTHGKTWVLHRARYYYFRRSCGRRMPPVSHLTKRSAWPTLLPLHHCSLQHRHACTVPPAALVRTHPHAWTA